jgi:hypothetical protein
MVSLCLSRQCITRLCRAAVQELLGHILAGGRAVLETMAGPAFHQPDVGENRDGGQSGNRRSRCFSYWQTRVSSSGAWRGAGGGAKRRSPGGTPKKKTSCRMTAMSLPSKPGESSGSQGPQANTNAPARMGSRPENAGRIKQRLARLLEEFGIPRRSWRARVRRRNGRSAHLLPRLPGVTGRPRAEPPAPITATS